MVIYETDKDGQTSGLNFVSNMGVNAQVVDDFAGTVSKKFTSVVINENNVVISTWASDSTYTDFPYKATVAITGMTAQHLPIVIFSDTDRDSGNYYSTPDSYDGGVYIYSKVNTSITLSNVMGVGAVST